MNEVNTNTNNNPSPLASQTAYKVESLSEILNLLKEELKEVKEDLQSQSISSAHLDGRFGGTEDKLNKLNAILLEGSGSDIAVIPKILLLEKLLDSIQVKVDNLESNLDLFKRDIDTFKSDISDLDISMSKKITDSISTLNSETTESKKTVSKDSSSVLTAEYNKHKESIVKMVIGLLVPVFIGLGTWLSQEVSKALRVDPTSLPNFNNFSSNEDLESSLYSAYKLLSSQSETVDVDYLE